MGESHVGMGIKGRYLVSLCPTLNTRQHLCPEARPSIDALRMVSKWIWILVYIVNNYMANILVSICFKTHNVITSKNFANAIRICGHSVWLHGVTFEVIVFRVFLSAFDSTGCTPFSSVLTWQIWGGFPADISQNSSSQNRFNWGMSRRTVLVPYFQYIFLFFVFFPDINNWCQISKFFSESSFLYFLWDYF